MASPGRNIFYNLSITEDYSVSNATIFYPFRILDDYSPDIYRRPNLETRIFNLSDLINVGIPTSEAYVSELEKAKRMLLNLRKTQLFPSQLQGHYDEYKRCNSLAEVIQKTDRVAKEYKYRPDFQVWQ